MYNMVLTIIKIKTSCICNR